MADAEVQNVAASVDAVTWWHPMARWPPLVPLLRNTPETTWNHDKYPAVSSNMAEKSPNGGFYLKTFFFNMGFSGKPCLIIGSKPWVGRWMPKTFKIFDGQHPKVLTNFIVHPWYISAVFSHEFHGNYHFPPLVGDWTDLTFPGTSWNIGKYLNISQNHLSIS
jgi:hypothetical protein